MPDIGEKGETDMNKRIVVYTEAPKSISAEIAEGEVVANFLPPPADLVRKESKAKFTLTLKGESTPLRAPTPVALGA